MKLREMSGSPVLLPIEDSSTTNFWSCILRSSKGEVPWAPHSKFCQALPHHGGERTEFILTHNDSNVREAAKVCRLYDIANVLSSLNFIEKTQQVDTRKPAF
ncbi:hypothetical protein ZEAMMB73_Zm00001d044746 [Zea mays]|uniref:E2F/DP family winged-helix DNA-binding domain-containing protein n=1 Tax=Zea mays TaxID=4577 RepID=A0A1D6NR71_MAIZE|nr:hypothetical protein ZEAMMB73_Zm00001d044746 [Zea mays]